MNAFIPVSELLHIANSFFLGVSFSGKIYFLKKLTLSVTALEISAQFSYS